MNAQTYTQVVNPVLAVLATPKQHQRSKQESKEKKKKPNNFDTLFHVACETADDMLLFHDTGCYGKDAQLVVGIVSSFNRTL